jgi:predicted lipoprotein with Yx(FWY)xxD motif
MSFATVVRCLAMAAVLATAGSAMAQPKVVDGVITDERGMSLYWWNNDVPGSGKSVCIDACTLSWPPMIAKADAVPSGDFSLITRDDGGKQWAHKGRPLYLWVNDAKPGDKSGDGFRHGLWHLAKPD